MDLIFTCSFVTLHWIQEPLEHFPDGRNTKFAYKTYFVEAAVKTLWYSIQDKGITPFKIFLFSVASI